MLSLATPRLNALRAASASITDELITTLLTSRNSSLISVAVGEVCAGDWPRGRCGQWCRRRPSNRSNFVQPEKVYVAAATASTVCEMMPSTGSGSGKSWIAEERAQPDAAGAARGVIGERCDRRAKDLRFEVTRVFDLVPEIERIGRTEIQLPSYSRAPGSWRWLAKSR